MWSELLGCERIGIHDDFFTLGGHSLLVIQVISRVRDLFQVELPIRFLFEKPTIAHLATEISLRHGKQTGEELGKIVTENLRTEKQILENIDQLTDDEVQSLLQKMMGEEDIPI